MWVTWVPEVLSSFLHSSSSYYTSIHLTCKNFICLVLDVRSTSNPDSMQYSANVSDVNVCLLFNGEERGYSDRILHMASVHGELGEASAFFGRQIDPVQ